MSKTLSRRGFLQATGSAGGALMIGFVMPGSLSTAAAGPMPGAMPNSWIRIAPDNTITILCARSEMGQGVWTSLPSLVAEELDVDLSKIQVDVAPAAEPYVNAALGGQITGGSTSIRDGFDRLRIAGAQGRIVLVQAAAKRWNVAAADCYTRDAMVMGPAGQRATYGELAADAARLTPPKDPALRTAKDWRYIGRPIKRLDSPAKVNGTATYGIDVKLPGMGIAALAQCPALGGKVKRYDDSAAARMPGVKKVVQVSDGVAVVADTYWHARKALQAVKIEWDESAVASVNTKAIMESFRAGSKAPGANFKKVGDPAGAMAGAAKKLNAEYTLGYNAHVTMEPMNFTADVKADSCLLVGPTQFQQLAVGVVADMLKLKPEQVTVQTTFLGGGFGRRIDIDFIIQAVEISKAAGMPVKLIWSREDDMTHDYYRPGAVHQMSGGLDAAGKPVAYGLSAASDSVTKRLFGAFVKDGIDPFMLEYAPVPYEIPNQFGNITIVDAPVRVGYLRAVSHAMNAFANECFMDEMAAAAGQDPIAFRMALLSKEPRYRRVLQSVADRCGWGKAPAGRKQGIALMEGYGTYCALVAEVSMKGKDIVLHKFTAAADLGTVVNPNIVRQQIESSLVYGMSQTLYDAITLEKGRVQQTNFHNYRAARMHEVPPIDITLYGDGEAPGGIGEPFAAMVAPAVANAVFAVTGKRLRDVPLKVA